MKECLPIPPPPGPLCSVAERRRFRRQRDALTCDAFDRFNARVFDGRLPADLPITWNPRLRTTAGITRCKKTVPVGCLCVSLSVPAFSLADPHPVLQRSASIELSTKVLDRGSCALVRFRQCFFFRLGPHPVLLFWCVFVCDVFFLQVACTTRCATRCVTRRRGSWMGS